MDLSARDRILHTAHDLFYRDGIRATGIDRVIAEAGVTKVTFYRHFPSKNDLVLAFLAFRHDRWMAWFTDALQRHGSTINALVPALSEWFEADGFRGCAFLNATAELGRSVPGVLEAAERHKADMVVAIAGLLAPGRGRRADADAIALVVDGAILRAQMTGNGPAPLKAAARALRAFGGD